MQDQPILFGGGKKKDFSQRRRKHKQEEKGKKKVARIEVYRLQKRTEGKKFLGGKEKKKRRGPGQEKRSDSVEKALRVVTLQPSVHRVRRDLRMGLGKYPQEIDQTPPVQKRQRVSPVFEPSHWREPRDAITDPNKVL